MEITAQVEIWGTPTGWLKEKDWKEQGFESLADYISELAEEGDPAIRRKFTNLPLVSFGLFNPRTGEKEVLVTCDTEDDLPTVDIEGVLEFNKN